jgi:Tol biopolymer transport system component
MRTDATPFPSPDGRRIALVGAVGLAVANADGSGRRRLAGGNVGTIAWSPDGSKIAYSSSPSPYPDADYVPGRLFVVTVDGSSRRQVARRAANVTWSPDAQRLAYDTHSGVVVARADGTGARRITPRGIGRAPTWSPRGSSIAFLGRGDVYVVNADGSGLRRVARGWSGDQLSVSGPADVHNLRWSPNGRSLAVVRKAGGVEHLFVAPVDGSAQRRLTRAGGGGVDGFAWSPEGRQLAFSRATSLTSTLFIIDAEGGAVRTLSRGFEFARAPGWLARRAPAGPPPAPSVLARATRTLSVAANVRLHSAAASRALVASSDPACGRLSLWDGASGRRRLLPGFRCRPDYRSEDVVVEAELTRDRLALLAHAYISASGGGEEYAVVRMLDEPSRQITVGETSWDEQTGTGHTFENLAAGGNVVAFNRTPELSVQRQISEGRAVRLQARGTVLDVDARRILVRRGGRLLALDERGRTRFALPVAPQARTEGSDVVTLAGGVLRVYDGSRGRLRLVRRVAAPREPRVRLADLHGGMAIYIRDGRLHLVDVRNGRVLGLRLRYVQRVIDAELEGAGLFYGAAGEIGFLGRKSLPKPVR